MLRADVGSLPTAAGRHVRGAAAVAGQSVTFSALGLSMRRALINGTPGAVSTRDGQPFSIAAFTVSDGRIVAIDILADPARLRELDLTVLDD